MLARSRLMVAVGWTILTLAAVYAVFFFSMGSLFGGLTLVMAVLAISVSILMLRITGSLALASNLLILTYFTVLTLLACCLGGLGAPSLPWYSAAPAMALCMIGKRAAAAWLVPVLLAMTIFYGLASIGFSFPMDVTPSHNQLLWLISVAGLTLLVLCMAIHYETTKRELERARIDAEAASRAKSEFLANMSHEIRTPMTAVLGFSDILMGKATDKEQLESISIIKRNGEYLIGVINDILDLSKIEAGKLEIEPLDVSIHQLVEEVASLMRVRADAKGLQLRIEFNGPIPQTIQTDPTRLRQILVNLVGNAIKFTEVGEVRLSSRIVDANSNEPQLRFDVIDSGIGIAQDKITNLFQPFSQADTSTTRNFGGTGLGLAISQRLARKLGGDVAVTSCPGKGSTFALTVSTGNLDWVNFVEGPCLVRPEPDTTDPKPLSEIRIDARVLLAEDGIDNQRLISFVLKKAGAKVVVAENGEVAYKLALAEQAQGNAFDVILMDMQMPVMDGYQATRSLRDSGYTRPIIALTAHAMNDDRAKCINAGCDDYSTKPIDRKALLALIAKYQAQTPSTINSL